MQKKLVGLLVGCFAFLVLMNMPLYVMGVLYFLLPVFLFSALQSIFWILVFLISGLIAYRVSKSLFVALVVLVLNFIILSALMFPKYNATVHQVETANGKKNRVSFAQMMFNTIIPFGENVDMTDTRDDLLINPSRPTAQTLTPPTLPPEIEWSEQIEYIWTPALLPFRIESSGEANRETYEVDGSIPIAGKLYAAESIEYSESTEPANESSSEASIKEYLETELRKIGWKYGHAGITYEDRITYQTRDIQIRTLTKCPQTTSYVGVTETSLRIIFHISAGKGCGEGTLDKKEKVQYVFISEELPFAELDILVQETK